MSEHHKAYNYLHTVSAGTAQFIKVQIEIEHEYFKFASWNTQKV